MGGADAEERARAMAGEAVGAGDPMAWFEQLYAAAEAGQEVVPWDRGEPHPLVVAWARERGLRGEGRSALVVGCGLGDDAEFVASLGFDTTAFDISATAIRSAQQRHPDSVVHYLTANLLEPPAGWRGRFDLVLESLTLQAMPDPPRATAIRAIGTLVAPGGTLYVNARSLGSGGDPHDGPPWALSRDEIEAIGVSGGLDVVTLDEIGFREAPRWQAEFRRSRLPA